MAAKGKNKGNEIEIFELLLNAAKKMDIMGLTSKGNSVLTLAIKYNEYDFAEYLFKNHANLLNIPGVNNPRGTGNENADMKILLNRHLPWEPERVYIVIVIFTLYVYENILYIFWSKFIESKECYSNCIKELLVN